ncbi:MAG: peptidylprolyl isomerase [Bdellovibrionales bacterium]
MNSKTFHVSHILVQYEYEAEDILKKLKEGASFSEMARLRSKCPSSARGGDLGPIPFGAANETFEEAACALKVGEMTEKPVRTRFGYHLIKR